MWEIHTRHWNNWSPWNGEVPQDESGARATYQHIYSLLKEQEGVRLLKNGKIVDGAIIDSSNFTKAHGG